MRDLLLFLSESRAAIITFSSKLPRCRDEIQYETLHGRSGTVWFEQLFLEFALVCVQGTGASNAYPLPLFPWQGQPDRCRGKADKARRPLFSLSATPTPTPLHSIHLIQFHKYCGRFVSDVVIAAADSPSARSKHVPNSNSNPTDFPLIDPPKAQGGFKKTTSGERASIRNAFPPFILFLVLPCA